MRFGAKLLYDLLVPNFLTSPIFYNVKWSVGVTKNRITFHILDVFQNYFLFKS